MSQVPEQTNTEYQSSLTFASLQKRLNQIDKQREKNISEQIKNLYADGIDAVFLGAGWGEYNKQIVNNFANLDRYGTRFVMDNYLRTGYTFITRPELNLTTINLRQDRIMALLDTMNPKSLNFALRCYLDSRFSKMFIEKTIACPFIDYRSPFFNIITNNLQDFSGGPSYQLSVHTDEEGFFGESQSMVMGSDSYHKPFDIQMTVLDPIGGPIDALMTFWTRYQDLVARGVMVMYPDQLKDRILNYTVSIYRFIMDPTFRYIRKWAKYTGCFPITHPGAAVFDYSHGDQFVDSLRRFSIGFKCGSGVVDVNDPIVINEFNTLVERYFPPIRCLRDPNGHSATTNYVSRSVAVQENQIDSFLEKRGLHRNPLIPELNYTGVPYIIDTDNGLRLEMIRETREVDENTVAFDYNKSTGEWEVTWKKLMDRALSIAKTTTSLDSLRNSTIRMYQRGQGISQSTDADPGLEPPQAIDDVTWV